jgi:hypothetical protein
MSRDDAELERLDEVEELGDEIATLAAHVHAATERLLALIARFDRMGGWESGGFRTCAEWLSFRTGIDLGTAREKVRTARALEGLPQTRSSMSRGELSFSQVRALTRVASSENEGELLELARGSTTAELERMVRGWKKLGRVEEEEEERRRHARRSFSVYPDDEGMYAVRGTLDPEVGAVLMRAVEAAMDALFCGKAKWDTTARQRRADAVGLIAERALAAGLVGSGEDESEESESGTGTESVSGSRAERYQVMLHVQAEALRGEEEERGPGHGRLRAGDAGVEDRVQNAGSNQLEDGAAEAATLEDATRVSGETCRRLACDASVVRIARGSDGSVLDVGRKKRTISPALRRALVVRDRGCRFPGCGLRFTDAHHIRHWADGGDTSLANCVLLCRFHHRLVHEEGWSVVWRVGDFPLFFDPRGGTHCSARPNPPLRVRKLRDRLGDQPANSLMRDNRARGVDPDWRTAGAKWRREADVPDRVYFRAVQGV